MDGRILDLSGTNIMIGSNPYPKGSVGHAYVKDLRKQQLPWTIMKLVAMVTFLVVGYLVVTGANPLRDTPSGASPVRLSASEGQTGLQSLIER